MRAAWHLSFVGFTFALAGCAQRGDPDSIAGFRNPFKTERGFDPSRAPTATTKVATRVHTIGNEVVSKNPEIRKKPVFMTVGMPEPMIFHRSGGDIVISEGLVEKCGSDAELAAVICHELGKMSAENGDGRSRGEQDFSPAPRLASDVVGNGNSPDMTRMAEQGFNDRRATGGNRPREPKADAKTLARGYLVNAGYTAEDLNKLETVLKDAEDNAERRDILKGR